MQGVLQGVVQKAARDSTLESAQEETTQLAINQKIEDQVKRLAANADVSISRRNFYSYTKAAQAVAEPYNDNNGNDKCDDGEPFQDNNGNGVREDRKSTRLNSKSLMRISYAVFCLKKKKQSIQQI